MLEERNRHDVSYEIAKHNNKIIRDGLPLNKMYLKSVLWGFALGSIFFVIAPLGLGLHIIEILKPALVPGLLITQLLTGSTGGAIFIIVALALNGLIFTIPFLAYFLTKESKRV